MQKRFWVQAAVLSVALASAASAMAQTNAVVGASGRAQLRHDEPTEPVSSAASQVRGAGARNRLENSTTREPLDAFIFSQQTADYRGPADAFGRASIATSLQNRLKADNLLPGETAELNSIATIFSSDRVTVTGLPTDNRRVTFHTTLSVFEGAGPQGAQVFYDTFDDSADFNVDGRSEIRVVSNGVGPSALGNDIYSFTTFHADPRQESRGVFGLPGFLDFELTFNLGQAVDFNVALIQTLDMLIEDRRSDLNVNFTMIDGVQLTWSGFSAVTDAETGAALCGLAINSAGGVNYGAIAACPGSGGGGTEVPEPATWALMIAGFGLTGQALRRRRLGWQALAL